MITVTGLIVGIFGSWARFWQWVGVGLAVLAAYGCVMLLWTAVRYWRDKCRAERASPSTAPCGRTRARGKRGG